MGMATQTDDLPTSPITPAETRGRIYERPGGSESNKGMWTFLLLLAAIVAAVIALAWAF